MRGNNDKGAVGARASRRRRCSRRAACSIYVLHESNELDLDPAAGGFGVVVAGHSHRPSQDQRNGVLFFNPGSAGPRRFRLPISVGRLHVERRRRRAGELVDASGSDRY